jgi:hypothetical protein
MVNKAPIKGKEAQVHNNLTLYCGFDDGMGRFFNFGLRLPAVGREFGVLEN